MASPAAFFDWSSERGALRTSIAVTLCVAAIGIVFGLLSGSFSIMFDGFYSLVDASMSALALTVVNLIAFTATSEPHSARLRERFNMGFWHLEPIVLGLNGVLLIGVAFYALINAISSLLEGGRDLEFGYAILYGVVTVIACFGAAWIEARANRKIRSDFIRLDVRSWIMSGSITAALLVAFCVGYAVQGTRWEWISPYIDPAVLALVCVIIIPMPISTVRQALSDILLMTPPDLKLHVDAVAKAFVAKHNFQSYRVYAAKVGRAKQIELYFIVPPDSPARTIGEWDALRDEVGEAIGGESSDRWLTVVFTGDREWAE
ncbi:cation transporter [Kaistia algarum]|uniref:cation diffusion facilitator family transporter n=1 Tax=Kaistia algarum TaxID=2083279 RepID=UPI000CE8036F|nr:cation transporter [Kaistia algarum]MCX5516310.1 cation transporter [Kaistia algarum]PPE78769.1 cation transporter [Kaistia algarum]